MKTILNTLYEICLSIGQARAAASLARMGDIEGAKAVYK